MRHGPPSTARSDGLESGSGKKMTCGSRTSVRGRAAGLSGPRKVARAREREIWAGPTRLCWLELWPKSIFFLFFSFLFCKQL